VRMLLVMVELMLGGGTLYLKIRCSFGREVPCCFLDFLAEP
jgi:hypothetical protein